MRLRIGRLRRVHIVAPHPDDEVIGAAGLIATLRRRGIAVAVTVVSDGAASHSGSTRWPKRRLVHARRMESRRGLFRLGVNARSVAFLSLPDGCLRTDSRCRRMVRRAVRRDRTMNLLVVPAADDAHPDHQAVAAALSPGRPRTIAYRVWPPGGRRGAALLPVPLSHAAKASVIRCHRTQLGAIRDDPAGFAIARHELAKFARPLERFEIVR